MRQKSINIIISYFFTSVNPNYHIVMLTIMQYCKRMELRLYRGFDDILRIFGTD